MPSNSGVLLVESKSTARSGVEHNHNLVESERNTLEESDQFECVSASDVALRSVRTGGADGDQWRVGGETNMAQIQERRDEQSK